MLRAIRPAFPGVRPGLFVRRPFRPHWVPSIRAVGSVDDSPGRNPGPRRANNHSPLKTIMAKVNLQMEQNDIIRRVLNIEDTNILTQIKEFITAHAPEDDDYRPMTKEEIMAELKEAFLVAKAAREGKVKGRPAEEFLSEL